MLLSKCAAIHISLRRYADTAVIVLNIGTRWEVDLQLT